MQRPEGTVEEEVLQIIARPLLRLATKKDLGRLLSNLRVRDFAGRELWRGPGELYDAAEALVRALGSEEEQAASAAFFSRRARFSEDAGLLTSLFELLDDASPLCRMLACVNQNAISPAVIRLKYECTRLQVATRDLGRWSIDVDIDESGSGAWRVTHRRGESELRGSLLLHWCLEVSSDPSVRMWVDEFQDDDNTRVELFEGLRCFCRPQVLLARRPLPDLRGVHMRELPGGLLEHSLVVLDLSCNELSDLPALPLPLLRDLVLAENRFSEVPTSVLTLPALRYLHMGKNRLQRVRVGDCRSLAELVVSYNEIAVLEPGDLPPGLEALSAHNNSLARFPRNALQELPALRKLRVHNNPFVRNDLGVSQEKAQAFGVQDLEAFLLKRLKR